MFLYFISISAAIRNRHNFTMQEIEKFLEYCLQLGSHLLKSPGPVMSLEISYFSDQGMKVSPPGDEASWFCLI